MPIVLRSARSLSINAPSDFPKKLGDVPLESPFTLAALSGYSDLGMRVTCRSLGACLTRNEVVLDKFVLEAKKGARSGRHLDESDHPVAAQLLGNDPETMGQAAAQMESFGYDLLDINFGCPVKKVLGRCRGGFLLGEPETAVAMIRHVRNAVSVSVTIKMRLGTDENSESIDRFWRILEAGVELGIVGVVVHGRTVEQRYEGNARWERLREVKRRFPSLIVFGSGDLFTANDCLRMLQETGIDGVTIARGAINNPWIFRDCLALWRGEPLPPPPTLAEQGMLMDQQYELAIRQYGPEKASRQMRKFGIKRAMLHPQSEDVRALFVKLSTPEEYRTLRERYYSSDDRVEAVAADTSTWNCGVGDCS
jgi:tRNA-dihydrouridine synthase B